jgi:glutamate carboxypeptidase
MRKLRFAAAVLGLALAAGTSAQPADAKLLAAARAAQPAVIESLREMVLIESGSQDAAG